MRIHADRFLPLLVLVGCGNSSAGPAAQSAPATSPSASPVSSAPAAPAPTTTASTPSAVPQSGAAAIAPKSYPLPDGNGDAVLDFLAYDPNADRVWIPMARDVGSVDVFDVATSTFTRVTGFPVAQKAGNGKTRSLGPSSAGVGDGVVYVGNRGTSEVCAVNTATLKLGKCVKVPVAPDGVAYVASTKEVWVTSPDARTIVVFDASKAGAITQKEVLKHDGAPEGYAVDDTHGVFYTNYEDKDRTVAIDIKSRAVKSTWMPNCGPRGPRGLVVDPARNLLVVACTDHVQVLDPKSDGKNLGKLDTGEGVDIIDYAPSTKLLYVAAGKAAKLTIARVGDDGELTVVATATTADRARNAVVDKNGNAYLVDPSGPRLLVVPAPK